MASYAGSVVYLAPTAPPLNDADAATSLLPRAGKRKHATACCARQSAARPRTTYPCIPSAGAGRERQAARAAVAWHGEGESQLAGRRAATQRPSGPSRGQDRQKRSRSVSPGQRPGQVLCRSLYPALREAWKDRDLAQINQGDFMARIVVTTDPTDSRSAAVLLDERAYPIHLDDQHAAAQLIERIGWAITDAESTERPAPTR
jgi:hypothetical protein